MKRVSLIAAGLIAASWSVAHADNGSTPSATDNTMPGPTNTEIKVTPPPGSSVDVNVDPATSKSPPPAAVPGTGSTIPGGGQTPPAANVDVNISPPPTPPPVAAPPQSEVMPPARVIDNNTAAISGAVMADYAPVGSTPVVPVPTRHGTVHDTSHTWVGRIGAGLMVGGGFEDFTNGNLQRMTGGAGTWNARAIAGTRQYVGVEAAYVGAARSVDALGVQSNAVLLANGLEGNLRLNVPVVLPRAQLLEPFGFVGLGWSHYQVTNTNVNTSDIASDDDVMSLPVGGGLAYAIGRFMADARFTYKSTYYNDLMRTGGNLNNWGVSSQVGFSF
jgi:hypothetical protein